MSIAIYLLVTFVAIAIHTATSFGFGIICIMVFPLLMPSYACAAVVEAILALAFCTVNAVRMRKDIVWKWITPTLLTYFIACLFAVRLLSAADDGMLQKGLGVVLVILSCYFIFFQNRVQIQPTRKNGAIIGAVSGVLESLFCASGPPIVLYLLAVSNDVRRYTASVQAWFSVTLVAVLVVRFMNGLITPVSLQYSALGLLTIPPGVYVGNKLLSCMNPQLLKRVVYTIMIIYGFILIFQ